jgi:ribosomal protein L29
MVGKTLKYLFDSLTPPQSSSAKVKAAQLWGKSPSDLKNQLDELKKELGQLRVQKIAGGASSKLTRMYDSSPR